MNYEYCDGVTHTVKKGDTLYEISRKYNVALALLLRANPYVDVFNLQVGDTICIPTGQNQMMPYPVSGMMSGGNTLGGMMHQGESSAQPDSLNCKGEPRTNADSMDSGMFSPSGNVMPGVMPNTASSAMPGAMQNATSSTMPSTMPNTASGAMSNAMPDAMSNNTSNAMPDEMSNSVSNTQGAMTNAMPDSMMNSASNTMPCCMQDGMSNVVHLPGTAEKKHDKMMEMQSQMEEFSGRWEKYVVQPGDTLADVLSEMDGDLEDFLEKNDISALYMLPGVAYYIYRD